MDGYKKGRNLVSQMSWHITTIFWTTLSKRLCDFADSFHALQQHCLDAFTHLCFATTKKYYELLAGFAGELKVLSTSANFGLSSEMSAFN